MVYVLQILNGVGSVAPTPLSVPFVASVCICITTGVDVCLPLKMAEDEARNCTKLVPHR